MTPDLPHGLAVVTGASSGIGEQFARQIAEAGRPLLLIARREDKLRLLADELAALHGIDTAILAIDLTQDGAVEAVLAAVVATGHPLGLFVNDAGFGEDGTFHETERARQVDMVRLNVEAVVALTHAALGLLVPQGRGAVLNVASVVAYLPAPGSAVYAASKAFVLSFTQAVHEEVVGTGVTVTALCPGATETRFFERAGTDPDRIPDLMKADPDVVAADGLDAVRRGQAVRVSGAFNKAAVGVMSVVPTAALRKAIGYGQRQGRK